MWYAAAVADYLHQANGWGEATITSGLDGGDAWGAPRVARSEHPVGTAIDIRSSDMPANLRQAFAAQLQQMLGSFFRVILEADHIHIELGQQVTI
jgi:hypothetical protein